MDLTVSNRTCHQEGKINYLEHVVVILHARFDRRGYLEGFLTAPSGTTSQILPYRANDVIASDFNEWPILSMHFWGEDPQGDWRLRLQSRYPNYKFSGENGPANVGRGRGGGCGRVFFFTFILFKFHQQTRQKIKAHACEFKLFNNTRDSMRSF